MTQPDTALTREIIQSAAAKRMLNAVSPIYGNARVGLWLFQVMGEQLDELQNWITEMTEQAYPQLVTWSMELWEKEYGIVTDCRKSLEERRAILVARVRERAPMTPYKIAQTVSAAVGGVSVRIQENIAANTFGIYLNTIPALVDEAAIRKVVDRCKPSHLIYEIGYEQSTVADNFLGIMLMTAQKLQIRQVN